MSWWAEVSPDEAGEDWGDDRGDLGVGWLDGCVFGGGGGEWGMYVGVDVEA